jgi:hypothetical protein
LRDRRVFFMRGSVAMRSLQAGENADWRVCDVVGYESASDML